MWRGFDAEITKEMLLTSQRHMRTTSCTPNAAREARTSERLERWITSLLQPFGERPRPERAILKGCLARAKIYENLSWQTSLGQIDNQIIWDMV